jgi:hypothetical protein
LGELLAGVAVNIDPNTGEKGGDEVNE